jgi:hypothetical protein
MLDPLSLTPGFSGHAGGTSTALTVSRARLPVEKILESILNRNLFLLRQFPATTDPPPAPGPPFS